MLYFILYYIQYNTIIDIHRIGRCSRFGTRGVAINLLYGQKEEALMYQIEEAYRYSRDNRMTHEWDLSEKTTGKTLDLRILGLGLEMEKFSDHKKTVIADVELVVVPLEEITGKESSEEKQDSSPGKLNDKIV
jgi:superfamily II DNA/RNA helicase